MEDLAIGVTHHWDDSWEADTGDNIRKIAVVNSCREIMRGFELFAQIIEMKIGKEKEDDNSNSEAEDVQLFKNDQPYEIKEESMEIKEEPIDDFSDLKLEEPIADIFCPSTGSSRPIDAPIHPSVEVNTRECGNAKDPAIGKKINSTGNYRIVNQLKANSREVLRTERVEGTKRSSEKKEINRSAGPRKVVAIMKKPCCLCGNSTSQFRHIPEGHQARVHFFRRIECS
ncbi:hypothetical protein PMAYCL1PPCAC_19581, partial [Pristionchus mayeri]